jgi:UDP-glucose 4-epimerase
LNTVVVGGGGFLGAALAQKLVSDGHNVKTFGRRPANPSAGIPHTTATLAEADLLAAALEGADCVYHFAWSSVPATSARDPGWDLRENVVTGLALLDACRDAGVQTVIFASSGGTVYGSGSRAPIREDAELSPVSAHGIAKLTFERYVSLYAAGGAFDYRILRISNAYGPGQRSDRPQGLISVGFSRMRRAEPITVWGDGTVVRDYVHVDDVVSAAAAASGTLPPRAPRVFNVGSGQGHSVSEVLAVMAEVAGVHPEVLYLPARAFDLPHVVLDPSLAERTLGWTPQVDLERGLRETWRQLTFRDSPYVR